MKHYDVSVYIFAAHRSTRSHFTDGREARKYFRETLKLWKAAGYHIHTITTYPDRPETAVTLKDGDRPEVYVSASSFVVE